MRRAIALFLLLAIAGCASPEAAPAVTTFSFPPTGTVPASPSPDPGDAWRALAPGSIPRTEVAVAMDGPRIVVVGGYTRDGATSDVVEIFTSDGTWIEGPRYPLRVNHAMAATLDGKVHIFGGYDDAGTPREEAHRFDGDRWTRLADMPIARGAGAAATLGERVIVAGGMDPEGLARSAFAFDGAKWSALPDLPRPRDHLAAASLDGKAYFVGGRLGGWGANRAWVETFDGERWSDVADMPTARGGLAAATWQAKIVAMGGEEAGGTFGAVEAFDGSAWSRLPDLPTPRHGLGAVAYGPVLYAVMGGERPGLSATGAIEALAGPATPSKVSAG